MSNNQEKEKNKVICPYCKNEITGTIHDAYWHISQHFEQKENKNEVINK